MGSFNMRCSLSVNRERKPTERLLVVVDDLINHCAEDVVLTSSPPSTPPSPPLRTSSLARPSWHGAYSAIKPKANTKHACAALTSVVNHSRPSPPPIIPHGIHIPPTFISLLPCLLQPPPTYQHPCPLVGIVRGSNYHAHYPSARYPSILSPRLT